MPGPVQNNFSVQQFQQLAASSDNQNIVLKSQGFEAKGKIGTFFAGKAASRDAANALFNALQKEYGSTIADALSPQLSDSMVKGKPLSARTIQNVISEAAAAKHMIGGANASFARAFMGEQALMSNISHLFSEVNVPEDSTLREKMLSDIKELLVYTAFKSDKLLGFADLENLATKVIFDAMLDRAANSLGEAKQLTPQQNAEMHQLVKLAAAQLRDVPSGQGAPSLADICGMAERGELPGQKALLFAHGKVSADEVDVSVRDTMPFTNDKNRVDMALIAENSKNGGHVGLNLLIMENLPRMREMQPEGPLTHETLWKGCFGKKMPEKFGGEEVSLRTFNDVMVERLMKEFGSEEAGLKGIKLLSQGISMQKCREAANGPVTLTMGDFISPPKLISNYKLDDFSVFERRLAEDLPRRGGDIPLDSFSPVIRFNIPGEPETMHFKALSGNYEVDRDEFESGLPSSTSGHIRNQCLAICNDNVEQANMLMMGLSANGTTPSRMLCEAAGVPYNEHSPHHMEVTRQDDGSVSLRIYTPHDSPMDADYTFTIDTSGNAVLTSFHMGPAGDDPASNIRRDPRLADLSEASRNELERIIGRVMAEKQGVERQNGIEDMKKLFLGIPPKSYDIDAGMKAFGEMSRSDFLEPGQQKRIHGDFHESFTFDSHRDGIEQINGANMPAGQNSEVYEAALRNAVPEQHHQFLPFISMMLTQAGMNSAALFLPMQSGQPSTAELLGLGFSLKPDGEKGLTLTSTENGLKIEAHYAHNYYPQNSPADAPPVLREEGRVTMEIDFSKQPEVRTVEIKNPDGSTEQREVLIPHFTITNGSVHIEGTHA